MIVGPCRRLRTVRASSLFILFLGATCCSVKNLTYARILSSTCSHNARIVKMLNMTPVSVIITRPMSMFREFLWLWSKSIKMSNTSPSTSFIRVRSSFSVLFMTFAASLQPAYTVTPRSRRRTTKSNSFSTSCAEVSDVVKKEPASVNKPSGVTQPSLMTCEARSALVPSSVKAESDT